MPGYDQVPQVTSAYKQQFWCGRLIAVGGKAPAAEDDDNNDEENEEEEDDVLDDDLDIDMNGDTNSNTLPLTYHQLPRELDEEVLHSSWARSVIDLMPHARCDGKGLHRAAHRVLGDLPQNSPQRAYWG